MKKTFAQRRAELGAKEARLKNDEKRAKARLKLTAGEVLVAWSTAGREQARMALSILNEFVKRPSDRAALADFIAELSDIAAVRESSPASKDQEPLFGGGQYAEQ